MGECLLVSGFVMMLIVALVALWNGFGVDRIEGLYLRAPTSDEHLRGLALTCASSADGAKECGWLWEQCVYGEDPDACDALGEAGRMARLRHGDEHPLTGMLT